MLQKHAKFSRIILGEKRTIYIHLLWGKKSKHNRKRLFEKKNNYYTFYYFSTYAYLCKMYTYIFLNKRIFLM